MIAIHMICCFLPATPIIEMPNIILLQILAA